MPRPEVPLPTDTIDISETNTTQKTRNVQRQLQTCSTVSSPNTGPERCRGGLLSSGGQVGQRGERPAANWGQQATDMFGHPHCATPITDAHTRCRSIHTIPTVLMSWWCMECMIMHATGQTCAPHPRKSCKMHASTTTGTQLCININMLHM